jgi:SAM-dependent methyltransferase
VLVVGDGTGLTRKHYPPELDELVLSVRDAAMRARLVRRVARRRPHATVVADGAEALPFPDGSFDTVVSTLVLCTVPDPAAALAELRRVLAADGRLLFIEHLRAASPRLARWQDRLAPPWRAVAAGCRCNQPTLQLLDASGLQVAALRRVEWRGMPSIVRPLAIGEALR